MTRETSRRDGLLARRLLMQPEHRRHRSFHECGHATWLFLDGRLLDIICIEITPRGIGGDQPHFQTGVCEYRGQPYATEWIAEAQDRGQQLARAARCIAMMLAGPVCECRLKGKEDAAEVWDTVLRDWWDAVGAAQSFSNNPDLRLLDFGKAIDAGYRVYPTASQRLDEIGDGAYCYLRRITGWMNELFAQPEVWRVVQALAAEFEPPSVDSILGDQVREIIREAWGEEPCSMPLDRLGAKWQRRFARSRNDP